jgi:hypothetical protein
MRALKPGDVVVYRAESECFEQLTGSIGVISGEREKGSFLHDPEFGYRVNWIAVRSNSHDMFSGGPFHEELLVPVEEFDWGLVQERAKR